jgi:hypothetical protein
MISTGVWVKQEVLLESREMGREISQVFGSVQAQPLSRDLHKTINYWNSGDRSLVPAWLSLNPHDPL